MSNVAATIVVGIALLTLALGVIHWIHSYKNPKIHVAAGSLRALFQQHRDRKFFRIARAIWGSPRWASDNEVVLASPRHGNRRVVLDDTNRAHRIAVVMFLVSVLGLPSNSPFLNVKSTLRPGDMMPIRLIIMGMRDSMTGYRGDISIDNEEYFNLCMRLIDHEDFFWHCVSTAGFINHLIELSYTLKLTGSHPSPKTLIPSQVHIGYYLDLQAEHYPQMASAR